MNDRTVIQIRSETEEILAAIRALHQHFDTLSHKVFCEIDSLKLRMNRVLAEVTPL
jgi:hypothetical protein